MRPTAALAVLLVASATHAAYQGLTWSDLTTGLDGVTPLTEIEGFPGGLRVVEVYARFDSPMDQAVGVVGSPDNPFNVMTAGGSSFVNSGPPFGSDEAPVGGDQDEMPSLHWDSYYTIGLRATGQEGLPFPSTPNVELLVPPGTPGPNGSVWGGGHMMMAWVFPPQKGVPLAETVAGNFDYDNDGVADNKVLLMRLVAPRGEEIVGAFGVLVSGRIAFQEVPGSFSTLVPAPGALAFLGLAACAHRRRQRRYS